MPQSTIATLDDIEYPDSDGQPMAEAETDFQRDVMTYVIEALKIHFQEREAVYVSGDLFIYYEEGNRSASVTPDVFVVFGVPSHRRRTYLLWQEGKAPDFVMEVTSESTREDDQGRKRNLYARLGVSEYWQYDPTGDYLAPPLQGFVLSDGRYDKALVLEQLDAGWSVDSPTLGLGLRLEAGVLRFYDPLTDNYLLTPLEENRARREAENRFREAEQARRTEARARQEVEARLAELEARLQALQQSPPGRPDPLER